MGIGNRRFLAGEYYTIRNIFPNGFFNLKNDLMYDSIFLLAEGHDGDPNFGQWFDAKSEPSVYLYLWDHFYTPQELRHLKLQKLYETW